MVNRIRDENWKAQRMTTGQNYQVSFGLAKPLK